MPLNTTKSAYLVIMLAFVLLVPRWVRASEAPLAAAPELLARLDSEPATEARSYRNASYAIDVSLDTDSHVIQGREVVRYRNVGYQPMEELWLHLYLNGFKNPKTTFMRESGGQLRGDRYEEGRWGATRITAFQLLAVQLPEPEEPQPIEPPPTAARGRRPEPVEEPPAEESEPELALPADLLADLAFAQPDDANPDDETVVRVRLPRPLPPGGAVDVEIAFEARLPRVFARTGYADSFHMVGQWFPKVGVFERRAGPLPSEWLWNCHQFHATTEFFSDYGNYDVRIFAPAGAVVGASGARVEEVTSVDGWAVHHYRAEDVHDFAFTADRDFAERTESWNDVQLRLLYQPEHEPLVAAHFAAARQALEFFSSHYGPYPYGTLTMVDPGPGAGGASGMEYPTLITVGSHWYSVQRRWFPWLVKSGTMEVTLIHEFGHQYWYGLVGSNEFEEAWLDEGFNSYSESKAVTASVLELFGGTVTLSDMGLQRGGYLSVPHEGAILTKAWEYPSLTGYGIGSYMKPATVLRTLENLLGEETFGLAMRTYFERWRFRHPRSEDFFAVVAEVAGQDLDWYWDQFVRRDLSLDYAVRSVKSKKEKDQPGLYDDPDGWKEIKAEDLDDEQDDEAEEAAIFVSTVIIERKEEGVVPVEWEVHFSDGTIESGTWSGRERALRLEYRRPEKALMAIVDPRKQLLLDVNFTNNSRFEEPAAKEGMGWGGESVGGKDDVANPERKAARKGAGRFGEALAALGSAGLELLLLLF